MSHLQFNANLNQILNMEGEIGSKKYNREKSKDRTASRSFHENSMLNKSGVSPSSSKNILTNSLLDPNYGNSHGSRKSPARIMPSLSVRTSGSKTPGGRKTPTRYDGDRFIPSRSTLNIDKSHQLIMSSGENTREEEYSNIKQKEYAEKMLDNLNDGVASDERVLTFHTKPPSAKDGHLNSQGVVFKPSDSEKKSASTRFIPNEPEKVLDAPELINDYYLHLVDWSVNNHLAVALGSSVFIWNAATGDITALAQYDPDIYVCSVSWIKEGCTLAVGLSDNRSQLWDAGEQKLIRTMDGHSDRVASLAWNSFILSSGSRTGNIINHDVRVPKHISRRLNHHTQEVCGLRWNADGKYLASGSNDNTVNLWDNRHSNPLYTLTEHQAAVKGLAWCPWQGNLLATGGGTSDRKIKIWNTSMGNCIKTIDTKSQVSSIVWSPHYMELASGHGYSQFQVSLWKYPTFDKIVDLSGHTGRVLELCISPDGQTVLSAAADETIRLWNCFTVDKAKKKAETRTHPVSALAKTIR